MRSLRRMDNLIRRCRPDHSGGKISRILSRGCGCRALGPVFCSGDLKWAERVSHTAEFPFLAIILGFVFVLSRIMAGWRVAFLALVSLAGMLVLGNWLGPLIGRPRPSAQLVNIFRPLTGYSFPSLFALRYAATFGFLALLAMRKSSGPARSVIVVLCVSLLGLGWIARVALGAHWPSDVIISYYLGLLWASVIIRLGIPSEKQSPNLHRLKEKLECEDLRHVH